MLLIILYLNDLGQLFLVTLCGGVWMSFFRKLLRGNLCEIIRRWSINFREYNDGVNLFRVHFGNA